MAMLFKEHLKVIKKETGEKPTKIAFYSVNDFDNVRKIHLKNGLKDACILLNIEFSFVETKLS